ncbi:MAG: hypothetical protein IIB57_03095 [Planctomycetes bacterium]|nr:hypothetical protein [Planctomycetota bacterium]
MIKRTSFASVAIVLNCIAMPHGFAQDAKSPDIHVDLNEGIYLYLMGEEESTQYEEAIRVFSSVLDRDPDNVSALLFRALSHADLGLEDYRSRKGAEYLIRQYGFVLKTRQSGSDGTSYEKEIRALEEQIATYKALDVPDTETIAEWNEAIAKLDDATGIKNITESGADYPDEHFEAIRLSEYARAEIAMEAEQQHYEAMTRDIGALIGVLDDPEVAIQLMDVVANAKIARIHETVARDIVDGVRTKDQTTLSPPRLRREASRRFDRAAVTLRTMIAEGISGAQLYRAKFLLGVILYRQAVPLRGKKERAPHSSEERARLDEALTLMKSLADDPNTPDLFAPYSAFYVGLILPFRAATETDEAGMNRVLDEANHYLTLASQLDVPLGAQVADSRTGIVPALVARQRNQIAELRTRARSVAPPINDIRLSLGLGINRDTNVELLGDNTGLPRDLSRDEDLGFSLVTAVDWTKQVTEKLTFGFQGRISQLWHADVDEFDQQGYGATIALQYQLAPKRDRFGPVFASLQYDYDYTLLGRAAFLGSHSIRPSLRVFWDDRLAESELYFRYSLRDYFEKLVDGRFNRDGHYFTFGFLHKHKVIDMTEVYKNHGIEPWGFAGDAHLDQDDPFYPARYVEGRLLLEYGWDATDGDEFDQKRYVLGFGVGVPLPWGVDMDFTSTFEWGNYSHGSLIDFHRRPRRSLIQEYHLAFSRTFVLEPGDIRNRFTPQFDRSVMTVRALASWTEDDSNVVDRIGQAVFSYDRWIYGVTVGFAFN